MLFPALALIAAVFTAQLTCAQPPSALQGEVVADGLGVPTAFTIAKNGDMFVSSLAGNFIWQVRPGNPPMPLHQYTSISTIEGSGPLGLALDPDFETNGYLYSFVGGENITGKIVASVYRFTVPEMGGPGQDKRTILRIQSNPAGFEVGGRIAFGPDGKLYVGVGLMMAEYAADPSLSHPQFFKDIQDWSKQVGKILRINKDGSFPKNNPRGKGVWAKGVRNVFGFTWDRKSPKPYNMWETEPGPDCNDEINLVKRGANLGFGPKYDCKETKARNTNSNGKHVSLPKAMLQIDETLFARPPTPTGVAICNECGIEGFSNRLFVATFQPGLIYTWRLGGGRKRNVLQDKQLSYFHGAPITALETDSAGVIHFCDMTGAIYKLKNKA